MQLVPNSPRPSSVGGSRRVILLALPWHRPRDPRVPVGHASLLASLQQSDIETVSGTFSLNVTSFDREAIVRFVLGAAADLPGSRIDLGIGAYIWNEHVVQWLLPTLRSRGFTGRIILGGPQVSYAGAGLEALYPDADVFVRGYGESAIVRLARSRLNRPIPGVHYAGGHDEVAQAQVDLASLASPLLSGAVPLGRGDALARMETQRGCPFRCSFCQHREAGSRLPFRELATERVLAEVDHLCALKIREVAILDPVFNMGATFHSVLDRFIRGRFEGKLSVQARLETADDRFLKQCAALHVVPEFGLQTIHRVEQAAVKRANAMDRVESALERLRLAGQDFMVTIIYGLPEQTLESFEATVQYLLAAGVPTIRAFPLVLLRGTELERRREDWDLREDDSQIPQVVASSTFDEQDHREMAVIAHRLLATEGHHPATLRQLLKTPVGSAA